jgi:hypothetical protein
MRWWIAAVLLIGCSKKAQEAPPAAVIAVTKTPADAAAIVSVSVTPAAHHAATPEASWPRLEKPPVGTTALYGPYQALDEFCAEIKASTQCEWAQEPGEGPFLSIAHVKVEAPETGEQSEDPVKDAREHIAIRTAAGWFAMPSVAYVGNQSGWSATAKLVDQRLVLSYDYEARTHGRWAEDYENGVIVCGITSKNVVACTDQIPTVSYSTETESRDDPQGLTTAKFACHAELKADHLIISEGAGKGIPKPRRPACKTLAYAGDQPITFPQD